MSAPAHVKIGKGHFGDVKTTQPARAAQPHWQLHDPARRISATLLSILLLLLANWAEATCAPFTGPLAKLGTMPVGTTLWAPASPSATGDANNTMDLTEAFPQLRPAGWQPWSVLRTEDRAHATVYAVLVVPFGAQITEEGTISDGRIALLRCLQGQWRLSSKPFSFATDMTPQLLDIESVPLVNAQAWSVHTRQGALGMLEYTETMLLLAEPATITGEMDSRSAEQVAQQYINTDDDKSAGTYLRTDLVPGSGWLPLGQNIIIYLALQVHTVEPDAVHLNSGVRMVGGKDDSKGYNGAWVLGGTGPLPDWCKTRGDIACRSVDATGFADDKKPIQLSWIAGAWPDAAAAKTAKVAIKGSHWFWAGETIDAKMRGPDGKPARNAVKLGRGKTRK